MPDQEPLPEELIRLEQSLARLSPSPTLSRDEVIFAAGRASASAEGMGVTSVSTKTLTPLAVSPLWRVAAACFAVASVVLAVALTLQSDVDSTVLAIQNQAQEGMNDVSTSDVPLAKEPPAAFASGSLATVSTIPLQQPSLHTVMEAIDKFTSRRDLAVLINGNASERLAFTSRPPVVQSESDAFAESPTRRQLLREFLPSTKARHPWLMTP